MKIEVRLPTRRESPGSKGSEERLHSPESQLDLASVPAAARELEDMGFHGIVTNENKDDPFIPLALAATATRRVELSTVVAIAFPRSPMVTAMTAWALQQLSGGRFCLGIGTQVKGHIERRYSTQWVSPGPRLREYAQSLRAIWNTWQTGEPLNYQGEFYTFTLMPPAFNAGPIEHPHIPIHIAAVGPYNCRVAGEVGDALRPHGIATRKYIEEVMLPEVERGAKKAGRSLKDIEICVMPMVAVGDSDQELRPQIENIRRRLAFYGSTRSYRPVFDVHGWGHVVDELHPLSVQGRWDEMPQYITDEIVEEMAVIATFDTLGDRLRQRFGDLASKVMLDFPTYDTSDTGWLRRLARGLGLS